MVGTDYTIDGAHLGPCHRRRGSGSTPPLPLTTGLLVDTSRSQTRVLAEESDASYTFLDQVLREGKDQAFVVHFDERVETLQGLTSSRSQLASSLARLSIAEHVATLIYSAVEGSSENLMKNQPGRKAFILLTDGVAYKDPTSIETAIEYAQRADTIIDSIRFSDSIPILPRNTGNKLRPWRTIAGILAIPDSDEDFGLVYHLYGYDCSGLRSFTAVRRDRCGHHPARHTG
jgi:VWFA-related protein